MHTYDTPQVEDTATDPRPAYILAGVDARDCHHVYRTTDETIHVVEDGRCVWVENVAACGPDAWMEHIENVRGWAARRLVPTAADAIARGL